MSDQRAYTEGQKEAILDALFVAWLKMPELRLGQLLANALIRGGDEVPLFYVEDFELLKKTERFVDEYGPPPASQPSKGAK